jgi:uncharacterized protein YndB with AHSA1/START domain
MLPTSVAVYRSFPDPVPALWPRLSRPELLERWLGPAEIEIAVGGDMQATLWNGDVVKGSVTAVAPPNCLDLSWRGLGPDTETFVRIRLEHAGPGSRIRVEQDDPGSESERAYAQVWWREALEALASSMENGRDAHEWGDTLPIVLRAPLARTSADVWPLLSTAEGLEKWLAGAERFEPAPGGAFRFLSRFQGTEVIEEGQVVAIEPERRVALDWEWTGQGWDALTRVELRLEPDAAGAALVLSHSGFEALAPEKRLAARRNYAAAWRDVLFDLRRLVAPRPAG